MEDYLTFEYLCKLIEKYNIPHNVHFMSDSGWECWATEMNGIFYNQQRNEIVFTQNFDYENDYEQNGYIKLV